MTRTDHERTKYRRRWTNSAVCVGKTKMPPVDRTHICWIQTGPDHDCDKEVNEEFCHHNPPHVRLIGIWKRTQDGCRCSVGNQGHSSRQELRVCSLNLRPVHPYENQSGNESPNDLAEDVVWDFLPRKALPQCQSYCYSRVEVATRCRRTSDDGEDNAEGKRPSNLKYAAKGCHPKGVFKVQSK